MAIKALPNWNEVPLTAARLIEVLQHLAPDAEIRSISINQERISFFDGVKFSEWRFADSSASNLRHIRALCPGILPGSSGRPSRST